MGIDVTFIDNWAVVSLINTTAFWVTRSVTRAAVYPVRVLREGLQSEGCGAGLISTST
jgi:hypothetical protein